MVFVLCFAVLCLTCAVFCSGFTVGAAAVAGVAGLTVGLAGVAGVAGVAAFTDLRVVERRCLCTVLCVVSRATLATVFIGCGVFCCASAGLANTALAAMSDRMLRYDMTTSNH